MAIGLGRIFGFHFLENFNYPFLSKASLNSGEDGIYRLAHGFATMCISPWVVTGLVN